MGGLSFPTTESILRYLQDIYRSVFFCANIAGDHCMALQLDHNNPHRTEAKATLISNVIHGLTLKNSDNAFLFSRLIFAKTHHLKPIIKVKKKLWLNFAKPVRMNTT